MYLLDANVLIQAKNLYYPFDVVPGFWSWVLEMHLAGKVFSIVPIRDELLKGVDELSVWVKQLPDGFFLDLDGDTYASMHQLSVWAESHHNYTDLAAQQFFSVADFPLVAHADAHGLTIVTQEKSSPESKRRILIPDACNYMNVPYMHVFDWIREERARF